MIVLVTALALGGCTGAKPSEQPVRPSSPEADLAERGAYLAQFWSANEDSSWTQLFVPLHELTIVPDGVPDAVASAAVANRFRQPVTPLSDKAVRGMVNFADGSTLAVPLTSAQQTFRQMAYGGKDCAGASESRCLTVTAAQLTTTTIHTSRGIATVPAWAFSVAEAAYPIIRVAIAPDAVHPLPQYDLQRLGRPSHLTSAQGPVVVDGNRLGFEMIYGLGDSDLRGMVWESDEIIVVAGTSIRPPGIRIDKGFFSPVWVQLSRPAGSRLIVEALSGLPLIETDARTIAEACPWCSPSPR
jgi:hypothetical protein